MIEVKTIARDMQEKRLAALADALEACQCPPTVSISYMHGGVFVKFKDKSRPKGDRLIYDFCISYPESFELLSSAHQILEAKFPALK